MNAAAFFRAFRSALAEDNVRDGRSYFDVYRHDEKAFTKLVNQEVVHRIIEEAGFTLCAVYGDADFAEGDETRDERLYYVLKKEENHECNIRRIKKKSEIL